MRIAVGPPGTALPTWKRWLFRCGIAGVPLTAVAYLCYLHVFGGYTLQRVESPDGQVIAEVNASTSTGTKNGYTGVMLRTKRNPFRETVFGGINSGARMSIHWIDPKKLLITCQDCVKLSAGDMKPTHWRDIELHYDIQN